MTLDRVQAGDSLSAGQQNLLIEQVNSLLRPGTVAPAHYGSTGVAFQGTPETRLALFELTEAITYPNVSGASTDHFDREPTAFAKAKPVWCHPHHAADKTSTGEPVRSYAAANINETTVWFPLARRDANGYAVGPPVAKSGTRVLCVFNRQSSRWEVVEGPPYYMACWGVLDATLNSGNSATVSLWWGGYDSGLDIVAYDWLLRVGTSLPAGGKVKVESFPQDGMWWITAAQCQ